MACGAFTAAVVHPCSDDALKGAIDAAERNLITPILISPEKKIRAVTASEGEHRALSPGAHRPQPPRGRGGGGHGPRRRAETLMKGSLHTDELLHE